MLPRVGVYHCFARSGGTLVNRLLGASRGVVVLSEVGPAASVRDPVTQAVEWLGLADTDEVDALRELSFGGLIAELAHRAALRGHHLVVRDFPTPNFLPDAFDLVVPTGALELEGALEDADVETRRVVVARRAASVYASITRSFPHLASLTVDEFGVAYHGFATAVRGLPVVRYEDLTATPEQHLQWLSDALGCPFDREALSTFAAFHDCTGDLLLQTPSRGSQLFRVTRLEDPADDPAFAAAAGHPLCRAADELFGFEPIGDGAPSWTGIRAHEAVLASTRRVLNEAVQARRQADDFAAGAFARADAAEHAMQRLAGELEASIRRADQLENDLRTVQAEADDAAAGALARADATLARADAAEQAMQRLASELEASMRRADELENDVRAVLAEAERLRRAWDQTTGELARAEAIAADRQRQVGALLDELERLGYRPALDAEGAGRS